MRAVAEEHSGYTIRDSDIKDIAPRLSKYGVEALATIQKREIDDRYQVDRITFRQAERPPRTRCARKLQARRENGLSDADSRSIWKKFPTHELPDIAFITVTQDVWKLSCETSILASRGGLQNLILDWYHPSDPRGRILREALPYVEYWRYRNAMCASDHAEDHQGNTIGRARQLQYHYQKVRKDPWLVQSLRELAQHGRAITIAVDVRLLQLMGGEVRITRNARISIQGRIPSQFWQTVFFEDTKTIIYTRGFEMGVAKGISAQGNQSLELRDTFAKESIPPGVARVEMEPQGQQWRLIPRVKCFLCSKDILEKVRWCPHCHRPISPPGEQLYGNIVLTERDKDHFQAILTRLIELNIPTRDVSARLALDKVERWP